MKDNKKLIEEALSAAKDLHDNFDDNKSRVIQLLQQALLPPSKFYKGQQVLVSGSGAFWYQRLYSHQKDGMYYCIPAQGATDACWERCKPDPKAVTLPHWVEHDGRGTPMFSMGDIIVVQYRNGESDCTNDDPRFNGGWKHKDKSSDIISYCIVPLPQYLDSKSSDTLDAVEQFAAERTELIRTLYDLERAGSPTEVALSHDAARKLLKRLGV